VLGTTTDDAMRGVPSGSFYLYLAPSQRIADAVTGNGKPTHPQLVPIGRMTADDAGVGRIDFEVPDVPAGSYKIVAYCKACAAHGTVFSAVGGFQVGGHSALPATGLAGLNALVVTAVLATAAGLLLLSHVQLRSVGR
jgi:hypothetical protein